MAGRTIAIGDIHGCDAALAAILEAIGPQREDVIVTLGDYVDRGPQSRQVIDRLMGLKEICTLAPLLGNHEEMMLSVVIDGAAPYEWLRHGGVDTLDSYGFVGDLSVIAQEHRDFLTGLLDAYETPTHLFFHANYDAEVDVDEQPEDLLRWVKLTDYVPPPHFSGRRVIVGHTHSREGKVVNLQHLVCLDTYCYGGGPLTAMDVDNDLIWQAGPDGKLVSKEPIPLNDLAPRR